MNILITGALGFIGSHLADAYIARGDNVTGIDNYSGHVVEKVEGMRFRYGDVRTVLLKADMRPRRFDLVVHCASPVGAVALLERRSIVAEIVETTQAVLAYCRQNRVPLINISSSEVYGFSGVYHEGDDCVIPHQLSHRIQYAAGKLAAEHLVRTSGLETLTVRPFNVAGPRQTSAKGFVIPTFVEQALAADPLTVFEGGFQERSFTAVWDVCDFILNARPTVEGEVVNVGNPDNRTTVLDLAERVNDVLGFSTEIVFTTGKEVHGPDYEEAKGVVKVPAIAVARGMGWEPRVGLDEMIARTADEIRQRETVHG